jgi:hypothetical protein
MWTAVAVSPCAPPWWVWVLCLERVVNAVRRDGQQERVISSGGTGAVVFVALVVVIIVVVKLRECTWRHCTTATITDAGR